MKTEVASCWHLCWFVFFSVSISYYYIFFLLVFLLLETSCVRLRVFFSSVCLRLSCDPPPDTFFSSSFCKQPSSKEIAGELCCKRNGEIGKFFVETNGANDRPMPKMLTRSRMRLMVLVSLNCSLASLKDSLLWRLAYLSLHVYLCVCVVPSICICPRRRILRTPSGKTAKIKSENLGMSI